MRPMRNTSSNDFSILPKNNAWLSNVVLRGETHMKGQNVSAGNNRKLPSLKLWRNPWCHIIQLCKHSPVVPWWMALSFTARTCPKVAPALSGRMRIQMSSAWFGVYKYLTPNKQRIFFKNTEKKNQKSNKQNQAYDAVWWMKKTPQPLSEEPPAFTTAFLRPNKEAGLEAQLSGTALA